MGNMDVRQRLSLLFKASAKVTEGSDMSSCWRGCGRVEVGSRSGRGYVTKGAVTHWYLVPRPQCPLPSTIRRERGDPGLACVGSGQVSRAISVQICAQT